MRASFIHQPIELDVAQNRSIWQRADRGDLLNIAYGLIVLSTVLISYVMGTFDLLPYDPEEMDLDLMMMGPFTEGHILGTDFMGRDMMSRLILGTQAYFLPGMLAIFISLTLGSLLGVLAGYEGGKTDKVVTYLNNLIDSFPRLVLILLVVAAFKPNIYYIMIVVGLTNAPIVAASIKNKIISLKQRNFVESAVAMGFPKHTIIFKHILWYNCRALLIIQATLGMAEAILMETSLSYLGFGVQEPTPSWGNMVQAGSNYLMQGDFWPSTAPALAILFTILGFHLLGDGLNNVLEGKK